MGGNEVYEKAFDYGEGADVQPGINVLHGLQQGSCGEIHPAGYAPVAVAWCGTQSNKNFFFLIPAYVMQ